MSGKNEGAVSALRRVTDLLHTQKIQKYILFISIAAISVISIIVSNILGSPFDGALLDGRVLTSCLAVFYAAISAMILLPEESHAVDFPTQINYSAKVIMLMQISRRIFVIPFAIFFLILHYGLLRAKFSVGPAFLVAAIFGTILVAVTALTSKLAVKMIAMQVSKRRLGSSVFYERIGKLTLVSVTVVIYIVAALLSRTDSSISIMTAAFTSTLGGTIPFVGWASATVMSIVGGEFAKAIVPLVLNITFVVISVLILLIFDADDYEQTVHEFGESNVQNNKFTSFCSKITSHVCEAIYRLLALVGGGIAGSLYAKMLCGIRRASRLALDLVLSLAIVMTAAHLLEVSGSFDDRQISATVVFVISIYVEIFYNWRSDKRRIIVGNRYQNIIAELIAAIPELLLRGLLTSIPIAVVFSASTPTVLAVTTLRMLISLLILLTNEICNGRRTVASHVVTCIIVPMFCFAM